MGGSNIETISVLRYYLKIGDKGDDAAREI